jgi:hypothetical protein
MKRYLLVLLAVSCVAAMTAAIALAHTKKFATETSVVASVQGVRGQVSSSKGACVKQRTVTVSLVRPDGGEYSTANITDTAGKWDDRDVNYADGGNLTVTVLRKVLKKNEVHKHVCRPVTEKEQIGGGGGGDKGGDKGPGDKGPK